jgi:hypothetical protein
MNNKFGRDNSYRNEGYRGEDFPRDRERREPFWRGTEGDRAQRSPDQEFETSGNYREPREPYGQTYSNRQPPYGGSGQGGFGQRGPAYGSSLESRSRFDGNYAPSTGSGWSSEVRGGHTGRGPKGYTRSDERIREDVCERLSWNDEVDATDIIVRVQDGEVTLEGSVETRHMKRLAEDLAEEVPGVQDIHNTVRVRKPMLTELKEKLTGEHQHEHFANTGTKSQVSSANGRA